MIAVDSNVLVAAHRLDAAGHAAAEAAVRALASVLRQSGVTGARVHDARIAAICVDHDARTILTADRDFERFAGIDVRNPMTG